MIRYSRYDLPSCEGLIIEMLPDSHIKCSWRDKSKIVPHKISIDEHLEEIYVWYVIQKGIQEGLEKQN